MKLLLLLGLVIPFCFGCAPPGSSLTQRLVIRNILPCEGLLAEGNLPKPRVKESWSIVLKDVLMAVIMKYRYKWGGIITANAISDGLSVIVDSVENGLSCTRSLTIGTGGSPINCALGNGSCCINVGGSGAYMLGLCESQNCTDQTVTYGQTPVHLHITLKGSNLPNGIILSPPWIIDQADNDGGTRFLDLFRKALVKMDGVNFNFNFTAMAWTNIQVYKE